MSLYKDEKYALRLASLYRYKNVFRDNIKFKMPFVYVII